MTEQSVSFNAPTQYVEVSGRTLAYRTFGHGAPLLLCVRFRGTMDSWDPVFLDNLVQQGFQVTVFDYSGLGRSTGERSYNPALLAKDTIELITALKLGKVILGGWSIGGVAAQIVLAQAPQIVSHLVLIATTPPGMLVKTGEQLFYDLAKRENDFEDFVSLFFEPSSDSSRAAAEHSWNRLTAKREDASPEVPHEWAGAQLGDGPKNPIFPVDAVLHVLKTTSVPVLHLGADHDIAFPVENWYALSDQLPTLHIVTFPSSGHGPQLQYPSAAAKHIAAFIHSLGE
ncbi:alpha/beta hydrolase [Pseudomonas lutea]|uniref:Alpha/beta hydrolase n=1 Tax=Pseudomonas lutea TaxID=243924 RepID=A0ABR9AC65_9PSED|nr:alpha/beta hydrolase [Pseudomonas lutea]MBD8123637.1 alpha/beta hydrolase [Pseudomonas lutea]